MKVALVGIGGYGNIYLDGIFAETNNEAATLVAGVDPQARSCRHYDALLAKGVPLVPSLKAMYDAGVRPDLIVLASPLHLHAEQAIYAMEQGSDVLCEKPMAATPDDAAKMIAARDRTGQRLAIGFQWAFSPGILKLKRDILAGEFGRPVRLSTRVYWPRGQAYYARNSWAGKLRTPDGRWVLDSPLNNACAHYVQNMLFLLGSTEDSADWPATVTAELYRANPIENYDTAVVRCRTQSGVELLAALSHATESTVEPEFEYAFERGSVRSDAASGHRIIGTQKNGCAVDYGNQPDGHDTLKLFATIDAINQGQSLPGTAEAAAAHTALMFAAQQSSTVKTFPPDAVSTVHNDTQVTTFVRSLDAVLDRCYATCMLPHELGVRWAQRATPVHVDGLTRFTPAPVLEATTTPRTTRPVRQPVKDLSLPSYLTASGMFPSLD